MIYRVLILALTIPLALSGCTAVAVIAIPTVVVPIVGIAMAAPRASEESIQHGIAMKHSIKTYWNPKTMDIEVMFPFDDVVTLASAAGNGDEQGIQRQLDAGVDINFKGKLNATPLYWAYRERNLKGFRYLLKKGANPLLFIHYHTAMKVATEEKQKNYLNSIYELSDGYQ